MNRKQCEDTPPKAHPYYIAFRKNQHSFAYVFSPEDVGQVLKTVVEHGRRKDLPLTWTEVRDIIDAVENVFKQSAPQAGEK